MKTILIASALMAGLATPALAHSGGLNSEGCHNDRRNGGYHCHRSGGGNRSSSNANTQPRGLIGTGVGVGTRTRYYANCSEARAAGAAPIRRGQPGYGSHLDRDGDGIACER
ncbi:MULTISPECIES: excalibur calcium-binding domain-containing protein [Brevundimonas]|uniref:excalibur calcium-binding domain-containing protein n=1 Tax=Brevundimonas pishanensis TaxID=2896315 RepID=UPI001FA6E241|nr:excalibur calcium-binding domain-containing protein [Brevundimonas pishanensis]